MRPWMQTPGAIFWLEFFF